MSKRLVLEGTISCIHHDWTGKMGSHLLNPKDTAYSIFDITVGRRELSIIRPYSKRFFEREIIELGLIKRVKRGVYQSAV